MKGKINLKTIIVLVILILVIVLGVLLVRTAKTYMSGAAAGMEPKDIQATVESDGKSATITWISDKESMGIVEYGTNAASLLLSVAETDLTSSHSVVLNNLQPNIIYHYRIKIGEDSYLDNGMPYTFKTKGVAEEPTPMIQKDVPNASPSGMILAPTLALSPISSDSGAASACNRTTDYNKDGTINSLDFIYCGKNGTGGVATPTAASSSASGTCQRNVDYNKDGVVNTLDYIKCLQTNKK